MNNQRFAIIDIGSNSIRLVITELDSQGRFKELHNVKNVARLSKHLNQDKEITEEGVNVLIETLVRFKEMMNFHEVAQIAAVGTAALRQSKNQQDIITMIEDMLGIKIRVLTDYEEAYYGYLAVVNSTSIKDGFTIDIGGGSTEVTYFKNRELKHFHSFPFGAVTLQSTFISGSDATEQELATMHDFIINQFHQLTWIKEVKPMNVIGIGGSARNLALIHQQKVEYPLGGLHQYEMSQTELKHLYESLSSTSLEDRHAIDGLSKDRADIIVPAALVISSFIQYVEAESFILSRRGLRDGILYEEMLRPMETNRFPVVIEESFHQLSHNFDIQLSHVNYVTKLVSMLYQHFKEYAPISDSDEALTLLRYSTKVLYIGEFINKESSSTHTFYLLTNMTIDGLNHKERLAIAFISSFKSKSQLVRLAKPYKDVISKKELKWYEFLGSLMKLAYSLNKTRRHLIKHIGEPTFNGSKVALPLHFESDCSFEMEYATKHKKHLERITNLDIDLEFISAWSQNEYS
ncbi:exopolyphosphatase [Alkalihalophilus lindianensis]|uniref:Exopolyphosphatase n=1 Tax=Alkalihalophilus lindianensis TaxID=1630542 RepID=A0ABU3X5H6_9BACI|nr:exopolyphosphatase [Alkalihalophilus lindianensis]MDV2683153.1 exopolyphosphatase [Alkalihalophilus lindianensis]